MLSRSDGEGAHDDRPVWGVTLAENLMFSYSESGGCLVKRNLFCFLCSLYFPFVDSSRRAGTLGGQEGYTAVWLQRSTQRFAYPDTRLPRTP